VKPDALSSKLIRRAFFVTAVILISLTFSYLWRRDTERKFNLITEKPVLLDEVTANPSAFKGRLVTMICYLWPGMEGVGLSTMPSRDRWRFNNELKRNENLGTSILTRPVSGWDLNLSSDAEDGDRLVIVQGYVFDSGYDPGHLLENAPYFQIVNGRMLAELVTQPR
jgi:hypothetical protein